jgi:hypothetical protein
MAAEHTPLTEAEVEEIARHTYEQETRGGSWTAIPEHLRAGCLEYVRIALKEERPFFKTALALMRRSYERGRAEGYSARNSEQDASLKEANAEGFREGAEAMRARASGVADDGLSNSEIAAAIRDLPLTVGATKEPAR